MNGNNVPGILLCEELSVDNTFITVFQHKGNPYSLVTHNIGHDKHFDHLKVLAKVLPHIPENYKARPLGFGSYEVVINCQ